MTNVLSKNNDQVLKKLNCDSIFQIDFEKYEQNSIYSIQSIKNGFYKLKKRNIIFHFRRGFFEFIETDKKEVSVHSIIKHEILVKVWKLFF